jgi:hypothetical protein
MIEIGENLLNYLFVKKVGEDMHEISGDLDGTITFVINGGLPPHKSQWGFGWNHHFCKEGWIYVIFDRS